MAQSSTPHSVASLRAITYRISSTPTKQLPTVAAHIAGSIWNCKDVLSLDPQTSKSSTEATNIAHRFKTTLTSLLQDRTIEGRWAAVVLTKAAIETGGVATLSKSNGWVKSLITILKKPDPSTTRQLAVITLTRIFMLTWDHSNLVREITTPALPAFISTCLSNVERERCSAGELEAVLDAFGMLIARHPTVFRTHEGQIRTMVLNILSVSSDLSNGGLHFSQSHQARAARVLVLLHHCAPKQGASDAWGKTWGSTIVAAHDTCDQLSRSIVEDSASRGVTPRPTPTAKSTFVEMGIVTDDAVGLHGWQGVVAGSERLITLINVLNSHLETATAAKVDLRLGSLIELIARILNLTLDIESDSTRHNHQIPKDEREALFCVLPDIHVTTLDLITSLLQRFEMASAPFVQTLQELAVGVFKAEHSNTSIQAASYTTLNHILRITGPSMSKADVAELGTIITTCCRDLLPSAPYTTGSQHSGATQHHSVTTSYSKASKHAAEFTRLTKAANLLLTTLATKINPFVMSNKSRVQVERTAILARNKDALVALVLNPAAKGSGRKLESSLLPILAREYPNEPEVEAILRPRMPPVVRNGAGTRDDVDFNVQEAEVEEEFIEDPPHANGGDGRDLSGVERSTLEEHKVWQISNSLSGQEDDLYSLTPPRNLFNGFEEQGTCGASSNAVANSLDGTKRSAVVEIAEPNLPVKRTRVSPAAESAMDVADMEDSILPKNQEQAPAVSGLLDVAQSGTQNASQSLPGDTPLAHITTTTVTGAMIPQQDDAGSDESDFEMPPLTMEPDTDPEDNEEDLEE